ncbi:MAG: L-rhamnose mutarotase [Methylococcaceae bacterium]
MKIVYILIASFAVLVAAYFFLLSPKNIQVEKIQTENIQSEISPIYGETNKLDKGPIVSFGRVIQLKKENELSYREMHADVWPEVVAAIYEANIRDYQLYIATIDNKRYLFSHFEYHGTDMKADLAKLAANPRMKNEWLPVTDSYQIRMPETEDGQHWFKMESIMQLK